MLADAKMGLKVKPGILNLEAVLVINVKRVFLDSGSEVLRN